MCKNNDLEDANLHNKIKLSEDFFFKLIQIIIYKIISRRPSFNEASKICTNERWRQRRL